jgi:hypothetical protein|tara:strand:- start:1390 stop:1695 length:306 start_codon:yes stop_codon:yes gene_type:complete
MVSNKLPLRDNQLILNAFENDIDAFKSMMESCYCYGGLTKTNKYILEFKETLGEATWTVVYNDYSKWLKDNYTVEHNVGRDNEGLTYNRLIPRLDNRNNNI